jgi:hypothetical protein
LTSNTLKDNLGSPLISRVVVGIGIEIDELREEASFGQKLFNDWIRCVRAALGFVEVKDKDIFMLK